MRRLVLASQSEARRELLDRLGIPFEVVLPDGVDETIAKREERDPERLARRLSLEKAQSVSPRFDDALIIGGDQVAVLYGEAGDTWTLFEKPKTEDQAIGQLLQLSGQQLQLVTAVALYDTRTGEIHEALDVARIGFRTLSRGEIVDYVRRESPVGCAGAFRLEGLGVTLMRHCRTDDFTAVMGLPLMKVSRLLVACGLPVLGETVR